MLSTLSTLFRASRAEAEEALVDQTATTLLAQHLRDARTELTARKAATARLMARETETARRRNDLGLRISRREDEARRALASGDESLAEDVANDILKLEDKRGVLAGDCDALGAQIAAAREGLDEAEGRFSALTEQLRRSRDQSLTRRAVVPGAPPPDPLRRAAEVAETMKARDCRRADMDAAYHRLDVTAPEAALDLRIKAAGLNDDTSIRRAALLKRIKGDEK